MPEVLSGIDPARLLALAMPPVEERLEATACQLYALSLDLMRGADDPWFLPYALEDRLKVFPTMAALVGRPADWMTWPELDFPKARMLQAGQGLRLCRPLRPGVRYRANNRIVEVVDKGEGRGAILVIERSLHEAGESEPTAVLSWTVFCRGGGGFGGSAVQSRGLIDAPPGGAPDAVLQTPTRFDAALLYRLTGDRNPIHADPAAARAAGLQRPVLHGLQVYGRVAGEILRHLDRDGDDLAEMNMRFSGLVYPGDRLETAIWVQGREVAFVVASREHGVVADRGRLTLR